jgi:predicted GNAT family acetyltransferase
MDDDVRVQDAPDRSRYEIYADGQLAGFTQYRRAGERADFTHTEIEEEFEGRGLASELIRAALDDARRRGLQVVPTCPFVADFIDKHAEYQDLVAG